MGMKMRVVEATAGDMLCAATFGDTEAIKWVIAHFGDYVFEEARAALGKEREQDAPDVCQEFYLALLEHRLSFVTRGVGPLGWLSRVIRSLAADRTLPAARPPLAHVTYDPEARAAYVCLVNPVRAGRSAHQEAALGGNVIIDLDDRGRIIGFEILDTRRLLRAETVASARRL
jgi:uncharacterized protein YuzE